MRALFDDSSAVEHDQPVHLCNRRQTVGNGDDGAALHKSAKARLDRGFNLAVERRRRLIQHPHGCILQDPSSAPYTLALAAGELDAALSDMRVVGATPFPVFQADDKFMRMRHLGSRYNFGFVRIRASVADVVAY